MTGRRARAPADARRRTRSVRRQRADRDAQHPLRQHDPAPIARRICPGDAALQRRLRSIVRWNAMAMVLRAKQDVLGARRPHRHLPVARVLYEVGYNHFWHAPQRARRRSRLLPRPLIAGQLRARVPRGPAHRGAARQLPPGGRRQRPVVLSASLADARLLAVPERVAGHRADDLDLPGALHEVPARPRDRRHRRTARCGRSSATARWTSPSRWARWRWRCANSSTISSGWSTATCSASTVRCAATARSSRSWRRTSAAPAGT